MDVNNATVLDTSSGKESAVRTTADSGLANDDSGECELLAFNNNRAWNNSPTSTPTSAVKAATDGWMDQIDASDELKACRAEAENKRLYTRNSPPVYKNATFLTIPTQCER